jgi:hypothetical protein
MAADWMRKSGSRIAAFPASRRPEGQGRAVSGRASDAALLQRGTYRFEVSKLTHISVCPRSKGGGKPRLCFVPQA